MIQMFDSTTRSGTAAGTILTVFANISSADLNKTVVLAMLGAVVSFSVTVFLKYLYRKIRK